MFSWRLRRRLEGQPVGVQKAFHVCGFPSLGSRIHLWTLKVSPFRSICSPGPRRLSSYLLGNYWSIFPFEGHTQRECELGSIAKE